MCGYKEHQLTPEVGSSRYKMRLCTCTKQSVTSWYPIDFCFDSRVCDETTSDADPPFLPSTESSAKRSPNLNIRTTIKSQHPDNIGDSLAYKFSSSFRHRESKGIGQGFSSGQCAKQSIFLLDE